jgi:hypothetical protein
LVSAIAVLLSSILGGTDESERRGGRTYNPAPSDALLHHAMGRDRSAIERWYFGFKVEITGVHTNDSPQ